MTHVQQYGNQLKILMSDGTSRVGYPTVGGLWIVSSGGGAVINPMPPGGVVIYPTIQHTVVDFDGSFEGHKARNPPSVNPGTDYANPIGTPVWAVADGVVTDGDNSISGSGGRVMHIDHTALGTSSDFLHLSAIQVNVGDHVVQGQQVALSGASGFGSETYYGPHLHISYRTVLDNMYTNSSNIDFDAYIKSLP